MTIAHLLEDFSPARFHIPQAGALDEIQFEEKRLESFEQGYSAGWEDAIKAQSEDQIRISQEMARNLDDLSFTYQDAFSQMVNSVTPVLEAITHQLLPKTMYRAFGAAVVDELQSLAVDHIGATVEIVTCPSSVDAVSAVIPEDLAMPVRVTADPVLVEGQAYLRIGSEEREVNLDALLVSMTDAIDAFAYQVRKDLLHG